MLPSPICEKHRVYIDTLTVIFNLSVFIETDNYKLIFPCAYSIEDHAHIYGVQPVISSSVNI